MARCPAGGGHRLCKQIPDLRGAVAAVCWRSSAELHTVLEIAHEAGRRTLRGRIVLQDTGPVIQPARARAAGRHAGPKGNGPVQVVQDTAPKLNITESPVR